MECLADLVAQRSVSHLSLHLRHYHHQWHERAAHQAPLRLSSTTSSTSSSAAQSSTGPVSNLATVSKPSTTLHWQRKKGWHRIQPSPLLLLSRSLSRLLHRSDFDCERPDLRSRLLWRTSKASVVRSVERWFNNAGWALGVICIRRHTSRPRKISEDLSTS